MRNDREANPDGVIDRVFSGLREAEPPQGMQQRVIRAARERAGVRKRPFFPFLFENKSAWIVAAMIVAGVAAVACWTIVRLINATQIAQHAPTPTSPPALSGSLLTVVPPAHLAPAVPLAVRSSLASAPGTRLRPISVKQRSSLASNTDPDEPGIDQDALARSEMNEPSHPAPPMPLTEQEKLLIRILGKGDPVELAMLDPGIRNIRATGDKADFDRFFKQPPKVVEIRLPPNSKPSTGDEK